MARPGGWWHFALVAWSSSAWRSCRCSAVANLTMANVMNVLVHLCCTRNICQVSVFTVKPSKAPCHTQLEQTFPARANIIHPHHIPNWNNWNPFFLHSANLLCSLRTPSVCVSQPLELFLNSSICRRMQIYQRITAHIDHLDYRVPPSNPALECIHTG